MSETTRSNESQVLSAQESHLGETTGTGSPSSVGEEASRSNRTNESAEFSNQPGPPTRSARSGGPRSLAGKARSRRNALKRGLSGKALFLQGESRAEFEKLHQGYRDYHRPVGTPEEILVKKMAWSEWCSRRDEAAEKAEIEIEKTYNSRAADRRKRDTEEASTIEAAVDSQFSIDTQTEQFTKTNVEIPRPGLTDYCDNPVIREKCLKLLKSLRQSIELRSFFPERDRQIINKIFGVRTPSEFRIVYNECAEPKILIKELNLTPVERLTMFLDYSEKVIGQFENVARRMDDDCARRERLESKSATVPEAHRLDRLLRYRASRARDYERNLKQLLQLQEIRLRRSANCTPEPATDGVDRENGSGSNFIRSSED